MSDVDHRSVSTHDHHHVETRARADAARFMEALEEMTRRECQHVESTLRQLVAELTRHRPIELMSVSDVAGQLGISTRAVWKLEEAGEFRRVHTSSQVVRFRVEDVNAFIDRHTFTPSNWGAWT